MAQQSTKPTPLPWGWTTRDLVLTAVVAAIFAVVNIGFAFLSRVVEVLGGPLGSFALAGLYQIPYLLAFFIVARPGASLLAGLIDGIVEVLLGNPYGAVVIVYALVQALGAEIAFAAWRWRSRSVLTMVVAGAAANLFGQGLTVILYGWTSLVEQNLWWILVAILSGGVFGLVSYGIGRLLENSGLLRMGASR